MLPPRAPHRKYTPHGLAAAADKLRHTPAGCRCAPAAIAARAIFERTIVMLDVIYLLVGAAFLGVCVLYAYACDHL
jgi:hypothetical protein